MNGEKIRFSLRSQAQRLQLGTILNKKSAKVLKSTGFEIKYRSLKKPISHLSQNFIISIMLWLIFC